MLFQPQAAIGGPIVKSCRCGKDFTADAWLDLIPIGLMDGGDDYTMLDLRNCPCGSTICVEVLILVDPNIGLPEHLGNQAILAVERSMEAPTALSSLPPRTPTTVPAPPEAT
jgi:hypothetical protein